MDFNTADICDGHVGDSLFVLEPILKSYGGKDKCDGEVVTIKLDEDNSDLISLLNEDGRRRVAVVEVIGEKCAVVGDTLTRYAKDNNWAGIIVYGYVRDIMETKKIDIALFALGTYPKKSKKKSPALKDAELDFGNVRFNSGDYIYADSDGVILLKQTPI